MFGWGCPWRNSSQFFEKEAEGEYHVFCPTLPGCHTQSETNQESVENIREAIELNVESLIEDGPPIPAAH